MNENNSKIEVLNLKLLRGDGPLKAIADVRVGDWSIFNWLITQHNGKRSQVFVPKTAWVGPGGYIKYKALLSIPSALKQRIEVAILTAWEEEVKSESRPQTPRR